MDSSVYGGDISRPVFQVQCVRREPVSQLSEWLDNSIRCFENAARGHVRFPIYMIYLCL